MPRTTVSQASRRSVPGLCRPASSIATATTAATPSRPSARCTTCAHRICVRSAASKAGGPTGLSACSITATISTPESCIANAACNASALLPSTTARCASSAPYRVATAIGIPVVEIDPASLLEIANG